MTHHLSDRDTEARTATCSVDGPVKIRPQGTGWACATRLNAKARRAKARRPDRKKTSDAPHRLSWKDPETRTGLCPECGPVDIVPWGGGWACRERAEQLGHVNHQDAPQRYCPDCKLLDGEIIWLSADGGCARCVDTDLNAGLARLIGDRNEREAHRARDEQEFTTTELSDAGLYEFSPADPYAMPEYESAVRGWQTIG